MKNLASEENAVLPVGAGPVPVHIGAMTESPSRSGTPARREPLFNRFPAVLAALGAAIAAVSLTQIFGPAPLSDWLIAAGAVMTGIDAGQPLGAAAPYVLHVFLHGGVAHLLINLAALASFGPPAAEGFGRGARAALGFLIFFFACAAGGALAQVVLTAGEPSYAVGASSALSGVLAAAGYASGGWRGALRMAAPWALINIVLALTTAAFPIPIAWAAHMGGLAAGLILYSPLLALFGTRRRGPWRDGR